MMSPTEPAPVDISGLEAAALLRWLEEMMFIREFEEALEDLSLKGRVFGGVHAAVGQEAVAVGVVSALDGKDVIASGHRPHHHAIAKGLDPKVIAAEVYGRVDGCARGRGGTMHLADFAAGNFGGNGIVGSGLGIATGAALAARIKGTGQVAVGFFGDGGANTGRVWECVNLAAVWHLPLIAVCENNLYAVQTPLSRTFAGESVAARAAGFGLPAVQVDGQDVCAVFRAASAAVERARRGEGPTFIEALTYRYFGHMSGEAVTYRTQQEVEEWRSKRDPITRLAQALEDVGILTGARLEQMGAASRLRVKEAVDFAEESPWPDPQTAAVGVLSAGLEQGGGQ
jgi:pyruvate dehydrogenase E1 component alpha subunit